MAVSVAETASNYASGATSVSVDVSGFTISAGDLLVAAVGSYSSSAGVTPPSGWTLSFYAEQTSGSTDSRTHFYYKVADSGDESATSYAWSIIGDNLGGAAVYRITGWSGTVDPFRQTDTDDPNLVSSGTYTRTQTLEKPNDSIVIVAHTEVGNANNTSNYFITHGTTNPTWTEVIDQSVNAGDEQSFSSAYAETTDTSDITAYGFDHGSGSSASVSFAVISTPQDASGTTALHDAGATFLSNTAEAGTSGTASLHETNSSFFAANGKGLRGTKWTNETKPSTDWTNETI